VVDLKAFWDFLNPKITRKRFDDLAVLSPKRICFGSKHQNALRKADADPAGYFNVPFSETISELFPWQIYKNKFGYSRVIKTSTEFDEIAAWIEANRSTVFIRSLLDSCVACCEHVGDEGRSEIGQLEYRAKWRNDADAITKLAELLTETFGRLYEGAGVNAICAVPSSTPGKQSLPCKLAVAVSAHTGIPDITDRLSWDRQKDTIKDKDAAEKWALLEEVGLSVEGSLKGTKIMLVDDLYQSGATVHFVASQLQEAGAGALHCIAISKSRGDKDNV
jgi:adenine/guanine phosphoribosyltransferase-like PRPP-binding protein